MFQNFQRLVTGVFTSGSIGSSDAHAWEKEAAIECAIEIHFRCGVLVAWSSMCTSGSVRRHHGLTSVQESCHHRGRAGPTSPDPGPPPGARLRRAKGWTCSTVSLLDNITRAFSKIVLSSSVGGTATLGVCLPTLCQRVRPRLGPRRAAAPGGEGAREESPQRQGIAW